MSSSKKSPTHANPFLKKATGAKPPTRAAMKTQQKHGGLGHVGRGLGGGLDNLITPSAPLPPAASAAPVAPVASPAPAPVAETVPETEKVLQVPPQDIERCPFQPRTEFRREELDDLVESIRENGVIQPLTCRRRPDGKLELICGERRQRASIEAGLKLVPVVLRQVDDSTAAVMSITENLQRDNLNPIEEAEGYQTAVLLHLGREYHRLNVVMQLHYSCLRGVNEGMNARLGPDTGFDMIAQNTCGGDIARLLSALASQGACPKTILYSLNPADNQQLDTLLGCFQSDEIPGKLQHGSAWWFNDTKSGMEEQMKSLANLSLLGTFVGMLTDSRSFLSYARHDYFRRILCNLIGTWVENGEYPNDEAALKKIVEGVCYRNAARYFNL